MSDTTDAVLETSDATVEQTDPSFKMELAKTASINAAATAGTLIGLVAVGLTVDKVRQLREKRAAKKAAAEESAQKTTPTEA